MKNILIKPAVVGFLALGTTACTNDLNISSVDPQTSPTYEDMELLAKLYGTLGLTGQKGPAGKEDFGTGNKEGESGFYRATFNLQEFPTDEINWAWQTDDDIPQITGINWNSTSLRTQWAYSRLGYDITLYNFYLKNTEDKADDANYKFYRAEVRFLRALHYWYFLDLWHKAPFKDETASIQELPVEKGGKDLYEWIDKELTDIEPLLATIGSFNNSENFGRADQGAAYMLHARLALNSKVYTDGQVEDYQKAIQYCDKVIEGPYKLSNTPKTSPTTGLTASGYAQLFMADNDQNTSAMQEIILPIRQDGSKTRCYSGSTYLISAPRIAGMPYAGSRNTWSCIYARPNLVEKFFPKDDIPMATADDKVSDKTPESEIIKIDAQKGFDTQSILAAAKDDRAIFYAGVGGGIRKLRTDKLNNFLDGISIVKWQKLRSDGGATSDVEYPDTDIPLMRLAEAYLTRAEAKWRMGDMTAINDVNVLRERAHAIPITSLTAQDLIDEWSREFYMEGRRRSDLIRFDMFTGKNYIWAWKGGVADGQTIDKKFNYFPVPLDDINNNPNMSQNEGY